MACGRCTNTNRRVLVLLESGIALVILIFVRPATPGLSTCVLAPNQGIRYNLSCHVVLLKGDKNRPLRWSEAVDYCIRSGGILKRLQTQSQAASDHNCSGRYTSVRECRVICELRVCPLGTYGPPTCHSVCRCDQSDACDSNSGECVYGGCLSGYFGPPFCRRPCNCLFRTVCDKKSGECALGCKPGWTGKSCQERLCPVGFAVPPRCNFQCRCITDGDCDVMTGSCAGECSAGWRGIKCSQQLCPGNSSDCKPCHCSDPKCVDPTRCQQDKELCPPDWSGPLCSVRKCPFGFYGVPDCNNTCHCASNRFCSPLDGDCNGMPCEPGRVGRRCLQPGCPLARFGLPVCQSFCFCRHGSPCDPATGTCPEGCKLGWEGPQCNQRACPEAKFNHPLCNLECHCENQTMCNSVSGTCETMDCQDGWGGTNCLQKLWSETYKIHTEAWEIGTAITFLLVATACTVWCVKLASRPPPHDISGIDSEEFVGIQTSFWFAKDRGPEGKKQIE